MVVRKIDFESLLEISVMENSDTKKWILENVCTSEVRSSVLTTELITTKFTPYLYFGSKYMHKHLKINLDRIVISISRCKNNPFIGQKLVFNFFYMAPRITKKNIKNKPLGPSTIWYRLQPIFLIANAFLLNVFAQNICA